MLKPLQIVYFLLLNTSHCLETRNPDPVHSVSCLDDTAVRACGASAEGDDHLTARPHCRLRALDSEEPSPAQRGPAAPRAERPAHADPRRTPREAQRSRAHTAPRPGEGKPTLQINACISLHRTPELRVLYSFTRTLCGIFSCRIKTAGTF